MEDGGVLVKCLSYAKSVEDIPLALAAYQRIRKPRVENIQVAALQAGVQKALKDGIRQRKRDEKLAERRDPCNPKYQAWIAGASLDWLYSYNYVDAVSYIWILSKVALLISTSPMKNFIGPSA